MDFTEPLYRIYCHDFIGLYMVFYRRFYYGEIIMLYRTSSAEAHIRI